MDLKQGIQEFHRKYVLGPADNVVVVCRITAAGIVPCGDTKKSPRTSSIVQIIFSF